jgi:asparagine synthase (glutamine-hydrolysing)
VSGFFGMVREDGAQIDENLLHKIVEQMRFRGPDGLRVWSDKGIGGCFALMRTGPAPQAERQPVELGGRYRLWGDLRLDARGELLRQVASDAGGGSVSSEELFLQAWQCWGEGALERITGDFSVALWDERERALWCARDFIGSRPFYYAQVGAVFCFSNTLEILKSVPQVRQELDEMYVGDFLLECLHLEPSRTIYRDIRRLQPGHVLKLSQGKVTVHRFSKLPVEKPLRFKRPEEYAENYREVGPRSRTVYRIPRHRCI